MVSTRPARIKPSPKRTMYEKLKSHELEMDLEKQKAMKDRYDIFMGRTDNPWEKKENPPTPDDLAAPVPRKGLQQVRYNKGGMIKDQCRDYGK